MRSSTIAFALTLAAASPLSVLAAGGSSATVTHSTEAIASVDSTLADHSTILPITAVVGTNATATKPSSLTSTTTYASPLFPSAPIPYTYNTAYSGTAASSASLSSVSGQPGVYPNGTTVTTGTATAANGGTSTLTSVTEVPGATTSNSASKTGPAPSATKSASLAAGSLSLNGNALGAGTMLLAGVAMVFGML
ncbi:hypothetical protein CJF31_00010154 [Rutstroemia sp. NJR-2017a BVV2]|nr:hypothetical protein CJF31_00009915 [Rutstroemia sp. NJR-2017a BVV2]PQE19722.1 hypothetical protein CJF31_00010154 [Rutstroemia sp. NJR-2017a BVV2]